MQHTIYKILQDNVERNVISFLQHDEVFKKGLTNKAIVGYVKNPQLPLILDNTYIDPNFIILFHNIIKTTAPTVEAFRLAAEKQKDGFIYMIDQRDKHHPNTRPFDIIGAFELKEGKATAEDYKANPNYQIISNDGLFQLPEIYCHNILAAMHQ